MPRPPTSPLRPELPELAHPPEPPRPPHPPRPQPPPRPRPLRPPPAPGPAARRLLPATAGLGLSLALLCAACGAPAGQPSARRAPAAPAVASPAPFPPGSPTLQDLAAALGCTAEVTVEADELREGACGSGPGAYRIATFAADAGRAAWLAESRAYGGAYLVGARWVVTAASPEALAPARARLGGTIESGSAHTGPHTGPPEAPAAPPPAPAPSGSAASPTPAHPSHAGHA